MNNIKTSLRLKRDIWQMIISYEDENHHRKQKSFSTHIKGLANKYQAINYMEHYFSNHNVDNSGFILDQNLNPDSSILFSTFVKSYVESRKNDLSPHVFNNYLKFCLPQVNEFFDKQNIKLMDVSVISLNNFFDYLKNKNYSNNTIMQITKIIRPSLNLAYKNGIIPNNPYDFINPLPCNRRNISFYNKAELKKLLKALSGHKLELAFKIAIYYGLRRSELLGLRWSAIDFNHNTLTVNHKILYVNNEFIASDTLKTTKSYRTLPLMREIKEDLLSLQKSRALILKNPNSSFSKDYLDYIFLDSKGIIINPSRLDSTLKSIINKNNFKKIRFHDLRHSCASLLLSQGVQMKNIQEWLGHSSFSTTADIYSHIDLSAKVNTAKSITHALKSQTNNDNEKDLLKQLSLAYDEIKKFGFTSLDEFYKCKKIP